MDRQTNAATERMESRVTREALLPPPPDIPTALLAWLEQHYPARCYEATETPEQHLLYAGKVQLITELRGYFEQQSADDQLLADALAEVELSMTEGDD